MSWKRDIRTRRFWNRLTVQSLAGVGLISAMLGIYDVIYPNAISLLPVPTLLIVGGLSVAFGIVRAWPRPVAQSYASPNTEIRVIVGDIFSSQDNIVIGMSDTFDTETPHIIHTGSVQGQLLTRIYGGDRVALDADLDAALASQVPIQTITKAGKTARYALGTVATIRRGRHHLFCVGYTSMDTANRASATVDGFWRSLIGLWEAVQTHANGDPVAIPVIGGGQSRLSQILPAQDSIRFIALSFMLSSRAARVSERLDIFVRESDAEKVDMLEIQAFLSSLRAS